MTNDIVVALLGLTGTLLAVVISYTLGQRAERKKQSLLVVSEMLMPIEDWLKGAEKIVRILGDSINAVSASSVMGIVESTDERKRAADFINENTNIVIGILDSKTLQTRRTVHMAADLEISILTIEQLIKYQLLSAEVGLFTKIEMKPVAQESLHQASELKLKLENELQNAYKLIVGIKSSLA